MKLRLVTATLALASIQSLALPGGVGGLSRALQAATAQQNSAYIDQGVYVTDGSNNDSHCNASNAQPDSFKDLYVPVKLLVPGQDRRVRCTPEQLKKFSAVGPLRDWSRTSAGK
jgi:hypothetical protein